MKSRIWPPVPWLEDSLDGNYPPHREAWTSGDSTQKIKIYHRGGEEIMFAARHECVEFYSLCVYCPGFNVKCKYVWSVTGQAPLTLPLSQLVTLNFIHFQICLAFYHNVTAPHRHSIKTFLKESFHPRGISQL